MPEMGKTEAGSLARHRQEQIEKYWAGDMSRKSLSTTPATQGNFGTLPAHRRGRRKR